MALVLFTVRYDEAVAIESHRGIRQEQSNLTLVVHMVLVFRYLDLTGTLINTLFNL